MTAYLKVWMHGKTIEGWIAGEIFKLHIILVPEDSDFCHIPFYVTRNTHIFFLPYDGNVNVMSLCCSCRMVKVTYIIQFSEVWCKIIGGGW